MDDPARLAVERAGRARAIREGWIDWVRCERDEHALASGCWFDLRAARLVEQFFSGLLRFTTGARFAGRPFEFLPWQRDDIVFPLFGWKRADGTRRYRRAYVELPKKNGKSTLAAGLALWMMLADGEPGAECYGLATDREQAGIVFETAAAMVEASPALSKRVQVIRSRKRLLFPRTRSLYQALSSDAPRKEGFNAHLVLFDELHAQRTRVLWDAMEHATANRANPLHFSITTAGDNDQSICWEQHEYSRKLLSGVLVNDAFLPVIYAAETEADWRAEDTWRAANPSYGVTLTRDSFVDAVVEAEQTPEKEPTFRRYRLNQWIKATKRWLDMDAWQECQESFGLERFEGKTCYAGLDLATVRDLTALVLCCPIDDEFHFLAWFWAPEQTAAARQARGVTYETWARKGWLELTPSRATDYAFVRKRIVEIAQRCKLERLVFDPYNATQFAADLESDGIPVAVFPQHMKHFAEPTAALERLLVQRRIKHNGNECLGWQADLCAVHRDANGNIRPDKAKSNDRIDGIVAAIMALSRAMPAGDGKLSAPAFA